MPAYETGLVELDVMRLRVPNTVNYRAVEHEVLFDDQFGLDRKYRRLEPPRPDERPPLVGQRLQDEPFPSRTTSNDVALIRSVLYHAPVCAICLAAGSQTHAGLRPAAKRIERSMAGE